MADTTETRKRVAAILRKHPDAPHRTLAKALHEKHPMLFTCLENARSALRRYTGNGGGKGDRARAVARGTARAARKPGELPPLPKSEAKPWEPYCIDARRVLVLSDLHLPHHDEVAIGAALDYADEYKPDAILLNGDVFDFYMASRFDKDPTKPKLLAELKAGNELFAHLKARFGVPIYFRWGNHDRRWDHYLAIQAPLLFEIEAVRNAWHIPAGIVEHGIIMVPDLRPVMLGNLMVLHGDEKGKGISSPVNPARGAFLRLLASCLEGHGHRQSEHTERTADGKVIACWSTGCLCGLWPDYAKINRWSSGCATVTVQKNGEYKVDLLRIIDGKVY